MRYRYHVFIMLSLTTALFADEKNPAKHTEQESNSAPYWKASATLSQTLAQDKDGRRSRTSPDSVVATHSAWRRMEEHLRRRKENPKLPRTIEDSPEYVLGFIEGRLQVTCPEWWKKAVLSATISEVGLFVFDVPGDQNHRTVYNKVQWPANAKITEAQDQIVRIARGDKTIEVQKRLLTQESHGVESAEFTTDSESGYITWCSRHPHITLMKVHRQEQKWSQDLHGDWYISGHFGPGEGQRVDVVVDNGRVVVFSAAKSVIYLEVFDSVDGTRLSRFSSGAYNIETENEP